jgi:hypothetical protein
LIELSEFLQKISQACRINGYSRQHFYDITAERFSSPDGKSFEVIPIPITPIFFLKKTQGSFPPNPLLKHISLFVKMIPEIGHFVTMAKVKIMSSPSMCYHPLILLY